MKFRVQAERTYGKYARAERSLEVDWILYVILVLGGYMP